MSKVIVIEGAIAAGKSTLISLLKKKYPEIVIVKEPVDEWESDGILQSFYQDKKVWAYKFQTIAFTTRLIEAKKQFDTHGKDAIYILERSCMTDRIFMQLLYEEGNVSEVEYKYYQKWSNLWETFMPFKITDVVFVETTITNCMERLKARGRDGESAVTTTYQQRLIELHENLYEELKNKSSETHVNIQKIDANQEYDESVISIFDNIIAMQKVSETI